MKITIIVDNYVDTACLLAEHGFACLVEANGKKILFDTGQGEVLLKNMEHIGVEKDLDMIVFSHGHYDHTGGLCKNMHTLSGYTKEMFASEFIFDDHLKKGDRSEYSYIGIGATEEGIRDMYNLHLTSGLTEIADGIYLSGTIGRVEEFSADKLLYSCINDRYCKDMFRDEQYMVIKDGSGVHVITGCTHCGVVNLLADVRTKFPDEQILSLTGGLHMFRSTDEQISHIIEHLKREGINRIFTGHCTGLNAAFKMQKSLGETVTIAKVGMQFSL
ncbi:beta-lactamase domain protein [Denitrovibrio acetiphilus DSM 12809]|uniref:Beta-lactamase domain protein n=1 Tax=Denitrovibrio acetiphilus (strain DSM 12809 / NBRC 114555 / N2460) TaxID=522772 RepID=D4H7A9_DENA2|nr:MBL fold metallo-hydrolase [Denitrovibrio acetiphilus]ADD67908.1 beta-lactamase domain protein [Denitrovibrio acetiphilus DSM 12809]